MFTHEQMIAIQINILYINTAIGRVKKRHRFCASIQTSMSGAFMVIAI